MSTSHHNAAVRDVDDIDFAAAVLEESYNRPVVVDFWAPWCGPCRSLGPTLERLAGNANGSWTLAKVNVDNNQQLAQKFRVQGIPAVKAFVDGKQVAEFTGAIPESQITAWLAGFVAAPVDTHLEQLLHLAQTDVHAALQGFAALIAAQPHNDAARLAYARLLIRRTDPAALPVLQGIDAQSPRHEQAQGYIQLAHALQELHPADDVVAARYQAALQAFVADDVDTALAEMLKLVQSARAWNSDAARKTFLAMLQALGNAHPAVPDARRALAAALF